MQRFPGEPVYNPVRVLSIRIALRTEVIAHDRALNGAPDRAAAGVRRLCLRTIDAADAGNRCSGFRENLFVTP
jgi:hypothetical protein